MQIKATMRYDLTLIRMATIKKSTEVGEEVGKRVPLYTVGGNVIWYTHYGKQYGGFSKN